MADSADKKPVHTLDDHLLGQDYVHEHDGDADHDHDHFDLDVEEKLEDNPIWMEDHVTLVTVGIDIGSSGTQVVFSRINLRRYGEDLTSRYYVVSRKTLFQSPVALTPYASEERIDEVALAAIIDDAYAAAALKHNDIDTGVVILTGEALRRENAEAIARLTSEERGDFVTASAGHHMESMLAAYGSGAAKVSHDEGKCVLNVDIGGGTTKLAIVENGTVVATAALHIGGRLQVMDESGLIVRLDPAGRFHAREAGFDWSRGARVSPAQLERVAENMAELLLKALTQRPLPRTIEQLYLTAPLVELGRIDGIMFSGGVGEYVYRRETRDFGDLGRWLGLALRLRLDAGALSWPLLPAGECIRATALGASEYSVQLSGNTSYISRPGELLPRRNLQVLKPAYECNEIIDPHQLAQAIKTHFTAFDLIEGEGEVALALRWRGPPSYQRIAAFAEGIRHGLATTIERRKPIFIVLDGDIAQTLGAILRDELLVESDILAIDGLELRDFDYIDLGKIRMPSRTVPVTIKSLLFSEDPRRGRAPQRIHHRNAHHEHGDHVHYHRDEHH